MRTDLKEIQTSINAAFIIQHPESIMLALEKVHQLNEVSGNQVLENSNVSNIVVPLAQHLIKKNIPDEVYSALASSEEAIFRSIVAYISAMDYLTTEEENQDEIRIFAEDRRDVQFALALGLSEFVEKNTKRLLNLTNEWLVEKSLNKKIIALQLVPIIFNGKALKLLKKINTISNSTDPGLKKEIVDSLTKLGNNGFGEEVLTLIEMWKFVGNEKDWIVLKTFSSSWAVKHETRTFKIIEKIIQENEDDKQIINCLSALKRNGATSINQHLDEWTKSSNPKLQSLVESLNDDKH